MSGAQNQLGRSLLGVSIIVVSAKTKKNENIFGFHTDLKERILKDATSDSMHSTLLAKKKPFVRAPASHNTCFVNCHENIMPRVMNSLLLKGDACFTLQEKAQPKKRMEAMSAIFSVVALS